MNAHMLASVLAQMPLLAILRGLVPEEAEGVGEALVHAGILAMEVPLNGERPVESIQRLALRFGTHALIGAGTVLTVENVQAVKAAGAGFAVMPHADPVVIAACHAVGLAAIPGFTTVGEGFQAIHAGADALKLFPAEAISPAALKAMRVVLPAHPPILPVGSIRITNMGDYWRAGADGFGLGSHLYKAGQRPDEVAERASAFVSTLKALRAEMP